MTTANDFFTDVYRQLAFDKLLQNTGEAARLRSIPTREKFPFVPWTKIVGFRYKMVHEYFRTQPEDL